MYNINNWVDLENFAVKILEKDSPKKTPGSGNSKKEEDVIGNSCIAQCKYTDLNSISTKMSDIVRLSKTSKLFNKFPLIFQQISQELLMTIIINNETEEIIQDIVDLIICYSSINTIIKEILPNISTIKHLESLTNEEKRLNCILTKINLKLKDKLTLIRKKHDSLYNDITIVNLFEGDTNATK